MNAIPERSPSSPRRVHYPASQNTTPKHAPAKLLEEASTQTPVSTSSAPHFVDLPPSEFTNQTSSTESTVSGETQTRRFQMVDVLCHRRSIYERKAIVSCVRKVEAGGGGEEYIPKIMWHDPKRGLEEVLRKAKGKFGLAAARPRWMGHGNVGCMAGTVQIDGLEVCEAWTDMAIEVPPEEGDKDSELTAIDMTGGTVGESRIAAAVHASCAGCYLRTGYWALFNLGILHRNICEGSVMMLNPGYESTQKPESNLHATCLEIKNSIHIESEAKLREVWGQLGGCQPTCMLSDFDLHAFHSSCLNFFPSDFPTRLSPWDDDTGTNAPMPKSRRLIGPHRPTPNTAENPPTTSNGGKRGRKERLIDFRTGTPAFMSIRALTVQAGERHHHSFIDDLEPFFWLVLWSATAHVDPGRPITPHAQLVLNRLNQTELLSLRSEKAAALFNCHMQDGEDMLDRLELIDNEWATHPLFVDVIIEFGKLACSYYGSHTVNRSQVDVFLAGFRIFQDALAFNDD